MAGPNYVFESHHRPGRYWTTEEKNRLRCELRHVGDASLPFVPNYQCFSDSPAAFDNKIMVIAREGGPAGRIVAFVSCILLTVDGVGTVVHTGLTCVLPEKRRQGFQGQLFTRLHRLLCLRYPAGVWFTSVSSSLCSLVSLLLATSNVFPSPSVDEPQDTHRRIAKAISLHYRAELDIPEDVVFDSERFVYHSSPDSLWYKDPTNKDYHHRNVALNDYYVRLLARVPGSEALQVGFMDPALYLKFGHASIKVGHASTAHTILAFASDFNILASRIRSIFLPSEALWCGLRTIQSWFF